MLQLTIKVTPNNVTNKTVSYDLATDTYCSISKNGMITGVSPGTTSVTIKTTDGYNLSHTILIIVVKNNVIVQKVIVGPNNYSIKSWYSNSIC